MKKRLALFVLTVCLLLYGHVIYSQNSPATEEVATDWKGSWVTVENIPDPPTNLWLCFRKNVDLASVPENAVVRIACDSKYWLWVNGEMLVFEGGLKRGPTPNDSYFDVVDLAPALKKGKNSIAILQWFFGKDGFAHKNSGKPALIVDGTIGGQPFLSDASWRGKIHPAYERITADPQPNFRLAESNIRFDARLDFPTNWTATDFNDADWANVKMLGKPPVAPWGALHERPIPQWKDYGLKDYVNKEEIPAVSDGKPIVCKLPYNAQVTPYLSVESRDGYDVDIRTDNYMGGSEYNVRAEYTTKGGVQEYESLGWMNGESVIYTFPPDVKIGSLKYRETGYDTEFAGSFECDDPFYNKLWEKSVRTLYITMRDNYMDCPDRERAQWWGDEVNELGEAFYALDPKSWLLARKGIYELMNWQRDDNVIFSPCPAGSWDKELPLQMLASIGPYGFGTWCRYADDWQPVIDLYPKIKKYLDIWQLGDDGLTVVRRGDWSWGDWGENIDLKILTVCWHKLALEAQLEDYLEYVDPAITDIAKDRDMILAKIKSLDDHFNKVFWTGTEYRDPEYKGKTDDRANAMAVLAGFAGADKYPAIRKVLQDQKHASPYMEKYVLEALFEMGYADDAMARMKERFRKMTEHPDYTTLWEGWGIGAEGFGGGTTNHAWSGGGLTCLAQYATGVYSPVISKYSDFDGFSVTPDTTIFAVFPQMGPLKWIKSTTPTKHGDIKVEMQQDDKKFTMTVFVPEGMSVRLLPTWDFFTEEGRKDFHDKKYPAWKDGKQVGEITPSSVCPGPGLWKIEVTK